MTYKEFIQENTDAANKIDLSQWPVVYNILEKQKIKLDNATLPEELREVKEFCSKAILQQNEILRNHFVRPYTIKYVNIRVSEPIPFDLKLLFEYTALYERATSNGEEEQEKKKESMLWFKIGLLFAKGRMEEYYLNGTKNPNISAPKIANEVNMPNGREYILATLNSYKTDKDIYNDPDKMLYIIDYCTREGIEPHQSFLDRLPPNTI